MGIELSVIWFVIIVVHDDVHQRGKDDNHEPDHR
jgi:hypothetical protein